MRKSGVGDWISQSCLSSFKSQASSLSGFTLLELLLVVAMLGILGSIVSLQLAPLLSSVRLDSGARQVASDLQAVRMKAIAQNRRFRVTFRPSTKDYVVDVEAASAWQRHNLHSHDPGVADDALIALPAGVGITAVNSGGDVIFVPRGHVDGGITITLRAATGGDAKRVVVNLAGRVRIQ